MNELQSWLTNIKRWYQPREHRNTNILVNAISNAPNAVFGPIETNEHSEALAYWLDACHRLSTYYQNKSGLDKAFSYLQFPYAKLQEMACNPELDMVMKRWCLKKLDRMIVAMTEFCQRQPDTRWQHENAQLIELHVSFMQGQNDLNLSYSSLAGSN
ncbi:hypothetical protein [uncultured Photobacterium sp.]|uniref:hypothetical protein n=1 Tax=uncultured Photobacterium sp. TaxID=173973 RepID=UPI0026244B63|nr:hypothetical protein [uncultured Photobacterium sp.]